MILDIFIDTYMVCFQKLVNIPAACGAWNGRLSQDFILICVELEQKQCRLVRQKTELVVPSQAGTSRSSRNHGTVERIVSFHTFSTPRQGMCDHPKRPFD